MKAYTIFVASFVLVIGTFVMIGLSISVYSLSLKNDNLKVQLEVKDVTGDNVAILPNFPKLELNKNIKKISLFYNVKNVLFRYSLFIYVEHPKLGDFTIDTDYYNSYEGLINRLLEISDQLGEDNEW